MFKLLCKEVSDAVARAMTSGVCLLLSGAAFYRGYSYDDPMGPYVTGPVMCLVLALNLAITGVLIAARVGQAEEQQPA